MAAFFLLLSLVLLQWTAAQDSHIQYRPGECLPGDKHREVSCPHPETPEYTACRQYSDSTCCTAEFASQLAGDRVIDVDGFRWDRCGNLSQRCHDYFVHVECFYRCSPNVAHWAHPNFTSALLQLPVCGEFCDSWFEACASDMTCATNWIFEWVHINGENHCLNGSSCRNFSEVYKSGHGLCETMWGQSFVYSDDTAADPNRQCLTMEWSADSANPNLEAIRNIFGEDVENVEPASCGAWPVGVASAILLLIAVLTSLSL